jgi:hypothetical protein
MSLLKNFDPFKAPTSLRIVDLLKKFDKSLGATGKSYGAGKARREDPWNFLFIAGMWFQDLFNYDFRRTEMCIIPYGTQEGEISFCAYNTGIGWRNIIENMHQNATVAKWFKEHGRHEVFAAGKDVPLETTEHELVVNPTAAAAVRQLSDGPQTAAEEARMMRKLFNEMVLERQGSKQPDQLVSISGMKSKKNNGTPAVM